MSSEPVDSGGSGGGIRAIAENFVDDGEILWTRLATTIVGGAYLSIVTGFIEGVLTTFEEVGGLYVAIGEFFAELVGVVVGAPTASFSASYAELSAYVGSMGIAGFLAGIASVLLILRIVAWGWASV